MDLGPKTQAATVSERYAEEGRREGFQVSSSQFDYSRTQLEELRDMHRCLSEILLNARRALRVGSCVFFVVYRDVPPGERVSFFVIAH